MDPRPCVGCGAPVPDIPGPTHRYLGASPLHPVATATCVQVRSGNRLITDGPFAETTEQLGGYFLIDVANLDEALAVAGRIPGAKKGTVEVRPVFELTGLPKAKGVGPTG